MLVLGEIWGNGARGFDEVLYSKTGKKYCVGILHS